jgi:hypothetical protein
LYLPTRRLHSGVLQVFGGLDALSIAADGDALLSELESGPTRWLPAGRDRFVETRTGLPLAVARDETGRVIRVGSPLLNAVSQYEPAPASVRYLPMLLGAPVILLLQALATAIGWAVRRRRKDGTSHRPKPSGLPRASAGAFWLLLLTTIVWAFYLVVQVVEPDALSGFRASLRVLNLLAITAAFAAALIVADALVAWRDPSRGIWAAAGKTATACAAVAIVWLLFAFDFATISPW